MPFPLAHPAAVLPLRRWCPRWFSLPALVIGSIAPDTGYFLGRWGVADLAHKFSGSLLYSLPVGLILLGMLYGSAFVLRHRLPARWRRLLPRLSLPPVGSPVGIAVSLLVGAWTHLAWDELTHKEGWLVHTWPLASVQVFSLFGHVVRLHHLLWYLSSFAGVVVVYIACERAAERSGSVPRISRTRQFLHALIVATLILPISAIHHLVQPPWGNLLAACLTLLLLLWVARRFAPEPTPPAPPGLNSSIDTARLW